MNIYHGLDDSIKKQFTCRLFCLLLLIVTIIYCSVVILHDTDKHETMIIFIVCSSIGILYILGVIWHLIYENNDKSIYLLIFSDILINFIFILNIILYFCFVEKQTINFYHMGIAIFYACIYSTIIIYAIIKGCINISKYCIIVIHETNDRVKNREQTITNI